MTGFPDTKQAYSKVSWLSIEPFGLADRWLLEFSEFKCGENPICCVKGIAVSMLLEVNTSKYLIRIKL